VGVKDKIRNTEKRGHERHNCEAITKWSYFNQNNLSDGKILNFSRSGIYLMSDQPIKAGTTIFFRLEILLSGTWGSSDQGWLRTISIGEVKWCKELVGNIGGCYGIGVQYTDIG
jgi:hypothetical protein